MSQFENENERLDVLADRIPMLNITSEKGFRKKILKFKLLVGSLTLNFEWF